MDKEKNLKEIQNKLWLNMKASLTYSWQCLIYTDKMRNRYVKSIKISRYLVLVINIAVNAYIVTRNLFFGLDSIMAVLLVALNTLSCCLALKINNDIAYRRMLDKTVGLDTMANTFKLLYQKYSTLYLLCIEKGYIFDITINDRMANLNELLDEGVVLLNKWCVEMDYDDDELVRERVDNELKEIFYNDVEQCPDRN